MLFNRVILFCFSCILLLASCNNQVYNQSEANIADAAQRAADLRHVSDISGKPAPPLVINQGLYVDKTPISLAKAPCWLRNHIILRGDQLPFSYYSRAIASGGGKDILTHYQVGLEQGTPVSINYTGTVKGALDLLAAKSGYVYTVNGHDVFWQAYITRTFDIAFMPGSSDYQMGKSSSGGAMGTTGGSGTSGQPTVTNIVDDNTAQEYSNLKGKLSVWQDLRDAVSQLLSKDGKVMVSESTTSVTVRDRPSNVRLISCYIQNLNHSLSKQVLVKVEILDVNLNTAYNYGIDWTLVKKTLGSQFFLNANYGTPVSITPLVTTPAFIPGATSTLPQFGTFNVDNSSTGVTAVINALTQQGKVAVVTQPRVVCLNNQVSVIRITEQTGYLASVQQTALGGGANSTSVQTSQVTSQITPGSVVTGLTLYILPKILGKKVYLQVNADLSNLIQIQTLSSAGTGAPTAGSSAPIIQVPQLSQKQVNQRAVIGSGDTLILSGFRQVGNRTGAMQFLDNQAVGGKAAQQTNVESIVLITPIILPGSV